MKDFIQKHKTLSWILGILGTLVIGGLGSGVWELVLKPILSFLSNGVITFLVNTSTGFSNEIYQSISMRGLDRFQAKTYSLIVMFMAASTLTLCFIAFISGKRKIKNLIIKDENCIHEDRESERPWMIKNYKNFYCFIVIYFFLCCIPFVTYSYDGMKTTFISTKIIEFEYLLKVNGDVITDIELKKIESQFAQIQNSEDYQKIIIYLNALANKNNKHINKNPL